MSFLSAKIALASLAFAAAFGMAVAPAGAQQASYGNGQQAERSTPSGEKSTFNPNCLAYDCQTRRPLRPVASRESCECSINVIRSGGRTIQVKNCYVQLPDNNVFYCKNPFAKGQAG